MQTRTLIILAVTATACMVVAVTCGVLLLTRDDDDDGPNNSSSSASAAQEEEQQQRQANTKSPTTRSSSAPTFQQPSAYPSQLVSTTMPSLRPSMVPTLKPSAFPTTLQPSSSPTMYYVEPNPVPQNADRSYFNYDTTDSDYGPESWEDVDTSDNPLVEFGADGFGPFEGHFSRDPAENRCGRDGKMSPLDLYRTDDGDDGAKCDAHHQIRTKVRNIPCIVPYMHVRE